MKIIKFVPRKEIEQQVLLRKCDDCLKENCINCEEYSHKCPNCKESLENEYGEEFIYCPLCGQKLKY